MPRYRITIEYDGTGFVGWQEQASGPTVQAAIADAIYKFSGERVAVKGAGRTDSGVHALGQVAHFDLSKEWEPFRIQEAANFHLKPHPIAVVSCSPTSPDFDARFDVLSRRYLYRILSRRARPALDQQRVWWVPTRLDVDRMHAAAQSILGLHDFTTFRASLCQAKSPRKTLDALRVSQVGEEVHIEAVARSFLHNQVRSMVGSLKLVGDGKWPPAEMKAALLAADRSRCGPVAPACGLYLVEVTYPSLN
ncbi:MAG: tRNA pseudouridine(38-40) synthase TruA [Alphaproteobacteria bacterium]|nr:tRNA pseudouridine(38-40) synthase TruA [Alphaproteobacteria bacterium]